MSTWPFPCVHSNWLTIMLLINVPDFRFKREWATQCNATRTSFRLYLVFMILFNFCWLPPVAPTFAMSSLSPRSGTNGAEFSCFFCPLVLIARHVIVVGCFVFAGCLQHSVPVSYCRLTFVTCITSVLLPYSQSSAARKCCNLMLWLRN